MNSYRDAMLSDDDERMRRFLVDAFAPSDPAKASNAELEVLREQLPHEPFSEERDESLVKKIETLMREAAQSVPPPPSQATLSVGDDSDLPPSPPTSPVLGFLGNFTTTMGTWCPGGSFTPTLWTLLVLVSGMALTLALVLLTIHGIHIHVDGPAAAGSGEEETRGQADAGTRGFLSPRLPLSASPRLSSPSLPPSAPPASLLTRVPPPSRGTFNPGKIAVVTGVYNARWSGPAGPPGFVAPRLGSPLPTGQELYLDSGMAELSFCLGAKVIVEGPAHLRLTSIDGMEVLDGKVTVRADTESARGFVVKSAVARMVNLGTEFGAAIERDQQTDLHVFQGMVEVSRNAPHPGRAIRLTAGQRIVMRPSGGVDVPSQGADSNRFTRSLATAENNCLRRRRWSESVRTDPDLVAYYTFDQELPSPSGRGAGGEGGVQSVTAKNIGPDAISPHPSPLPEGEGILRNVAASGSASAGEIRGARRAEGRWPGKSALAFSKSDDCVRLDVPGRFPALTLAAWVNLDGLDNEFNGLLMTDQWHARVGQCHWNLTRSGRMDIGVTLGLEGAETIYRSTSLPETDDFGRWLHLALVYDTAAGQVAFYADGRLATVKPTTDDIALALGPCEIGNWAAWKGSAFPVRNFRGRIDEFMVFRRALAAAEVKAMCEEGRP